VFHPQYPRRHAPGAGSSEWRWIVHPHPPKLTNANPLPAKADDDVSKSLKAAKTKKHRKRT
jgi:hypothetical protein